MNLKLTYEDLPGYPGVRVWVRDARVGAGAPIGELSLRAVGHTPYPDLEAGYIYSRVFHHGVVPREKHVVEFFDGCFQNIPKDVYDVLCKGKWAEWLREEDDMMPAPAPASYECPFSGWEP